MKTNTERLCVAISSLVFTAIVYNFYYIGYYSAAGDSAGFVDVISSIHEGEGMVSSAFSSIYSLMPYLTYDLEHYKEANFVSHFYDQDFAQWHAYGIAYIISVLKFFGLSSLQVAALTMATAMSGTLLISYQFLRKNKINIVYSLLFIGVILFYTPFIGNIFGQFYFDRFFIFFELLLLVLLFSKFENNLKVDKYIGLLFFLTASVSERPAIFASLTIVYFLIFYYKKVSFKKDLYLFILPIIGLTYVYIYMAFFVDSPYYSQISLSSIVMHFKESFDTDTLIGQKSTIFFLMVLPLIVASCFNYKYIILTVCAIIPNLIVTVGGAEKVGFSTHYHANNLPFLLFGAMVGIIAIRKKFGSKNILLPLVLVSIFSTFYINKLDLEGVKYYPKLNILDVLPKSDLMASNHVRMKFNKELVSDIPKNSKISTLEFNMPILVEHGMERIDYLPIGIGTNEFLLVEYLGDFSSEKCASSMCESKLLLVENLSDTDLPLLISFLPSVQEKKKIAEYIQLLINEKYTPYKYKEFLGRKYIIYKLRSI